MTASDGGPRCAWALSAPDYLAYHDTEWGFPVVDDVRLFEKLCLEGFQSGLSWITILRKRPAFREVFAGFDPATVAGFGPADVERLLGDARIIRHRGKIEATINNAQRMLDLVEAEGSLADYVWSYAVAPEPPLRRATSPESVAMSKDLKRRGWTFVGPTTVYAFMQAMGLVNDHVEKCVVRARVAEVDRPAARET
ncbi:MAG: DNA-3-methyladenine glycosylase I [Nocardioides sp.]|uniref:DNA-3-methyladenine glycosylase I n=1 Tax=Nocardioides sp. TaxID=35761 RepID=UPI0039E39FCB